VFVWQARSIIRDRHIFLKRGFYWINFEVMDVTIHFYVDGVRLLTDMGLLNGDGSEGCGMASPFVA